MLTRKSVEMWVAVPLPARKRLSILLLHPNVRRVDQNRLVQKPCTQHMQDREVCRQQGRQELLFSDKGLRWRNR